MSAADNASESILSSVAKHEKDLLAQVRASEEEARHIVEKARSDAREHLAAAESGLSEEVARIRREAEERRERTFSERVRVADQQLAGVREEARRRVQAAGKKVLALFVPSVSGGS